MIVYHGTTLKLTVPQIIRSEIGRDFGFAFYTTDIKEQAERWAVRKAKIESRRLQRSCKDVVNLYEWIRDDKIKILQMTDTSSEWLDMVVNCRSNSD